MPAVLLWLASRIYVFVLLYGADHVVVGDPEYYRSSLERLGTVGAGQTLVEYPVPAMALLALPYVVVQALGHVIDYTLALALCALAIDAAFGAALVHTRRWGAAATPWALWIRPAEWLWLLAVPALGATAYARFDLVPGVLVGLALLHATRSPRLAAVLGALATGMKYWPAIVLPALLAPSRSRRAIAFAVAETGALLALGSVAWGGWHRLWTPLSYLRHRGLQIESVAATPAMLDHALRPGHYDITYASSHAFEITGPMVPMLLRVSTVASIGLCVVLLTMWTLAWRRLSHEDGDADALVWVVLAAIAGFVVTGKVFSPQYMLWILPAAAAGLALVRDETSRRRLVGWSTALLFTTFVTRDIFPLHYGGLIATSPETREVVALLAARNLVVLALFGYALLEAARRLRAVRSPQAPSSVLVSAA